MAKVPWRVHVRLTVGERERFDALAGSVRFLRRGGGFRDAELARLLLISSMESGQTPAVRAAMALHSASVLSFSEELSGMLAGLRGQVGLPARRTAGGVRYPRTTAPAAEGENAAPQPAPRGRPRTSPGQPDRRQILVTVDDWLRDRIGEVMDAGGETSASSYVHRTVCGAVDMIDGHRATIQAYKDARVRVGKAIVKAIDAGRTAIIKALMD